MIIFDGTDGYLRHIRIEKEDDWLVLFLKGEYFDNGKYYNDWLDIAKFRDLHHLTLFLDSLECQEQGF